MPNNLLFLVSYWIFFWVMYALGIIVGGACVGVLLFVGVGCIATDYSILFLAKKGLYFGSHYAGVWAGGLSIIACCIHYKKRK